MYVYQLFNPMVNSLVHQSMHNIIIFGEAGSGKSSLVNMIAGGDVAKISDSADGTTFQNDVYEATIGNTTFNIYDTAGLNEGDQGRVPHWKAVRNLYILIRQLEGVSLLIYCMRPRVKENASANWILFHKVICQEKVPIVVVVTGLENREDPDSWWREKGNRSALSRNGMHPKNVACVVSFAGRQNEHEHVYAASQVKLRNMIMKTCRREPWSEEKEIWLANIYKETYASKLCFGTQSRLDFTEKMRGTIRLLIDEAGMEEEDSKKLEATLLKAEKRFRKSKFRR